MHDIERILMTAMEINNELNRLYWEHGDNEELEGAVDHADCLVWYVTQLKERGGLCDGGGQVALN